MEKIILEDVQDLSLVNKESVSPIPPKRLRTDWIKDHSEEIRFDLSATFQETNIYMQNNTDLSYTSECWYSRHEKPHAGEDTDILCTPITDCMSSLPEDKNAVSSRATIVPVERCASLLVQDVQPEVTNCDKLGSYSLDDASGELAKFPTVPDAAPHTSSHPDCKLLFEPLEDEPPGGRNLPDGNGDEGAKPQCSEGQIKALGPTSGDEEIRCQHGYIHDEIQNDTVFYNRWSQSDKFEPFIQKKEDDISCDGTQTTSFNSNVVENIFDLNLDEGVKIEKKSELLICENEDLAVSDKKGQVNENSLNKNAFHCEDECAEGSTVDHHASSRNIAAEVEVDVFSWAKGENAAGEMIAKARREMADHTAETPVPARISQESAEGDNDVSPFSVIDPAIGSETDREAVRGCGSQFAAGAELSPSLTVREMKMPLPLYAVTLPQDASFLSQTHQGHPCRTQHRENEQQDFCQTCSPSTNATNHKTGNEGHCLWKTCCSSSPTCLPVLDGREESLETVGHLVKEPRVPDCFHANLENLEAQVFRGVESETLKNDWPRDESSDEKKNLKKTVSEKSHEDTFQSSELSSSGHRSINLGSKTDRTVEEETSEVKSVGCEILVITMDGHQQENQAAVTQASPDSISECSERNTSDGSRVLASTLPTHGDAVVPGPQEVNPSYQAPTTTAALSWSDTLSPVPSAFTFGDRVPAGFDTFQRIQLSLEDDDKSDCSGSNSPLHTSLSRPRQLCHSMLVAGSANQHQVAPEEEEGLGVERFKCHTENTANLSSDCSCNDVPSLTTTPIRWPKSKSVVSTSNDVCHGCPAWNLREYIEFDMKKQFDMVLKELHLFFEISVSDCITIGNESVYEQCSDVAKDSEEQPSEQFFRRDLMHHKNPASGK